MSAAGCLSAFNLTNTPLFGAPHTSPTSTLFGVVPITQTNLPRSIELGSAMLFEGGERLT
jgi:hypothetical protein